MIGRKARRASCTTEKFIVKNAIKTRIEYRTISSSDGNLERWESEGFFTKEIIEKAFKIAEI